MSTVARGASEGGEFGVEVRGSSLSSACGRREDDFEPCCGRALREVDDPVRHLAAVESHGLDGPAGSSQVHSFADGHGPRAKGFIGSASRLTGGRLARNIRTHESRIATTTGHERYA